VTDGLLDWLAAPRAEAGISYLGPDGTWDRRDYATTARDVHRAAHGLVETGLEPGGIVALGLDTGPDFVAGFFGTLLAGGTPTTIPTLHLGQSADHVTDHLAAILRVADPSAIVSSAGSLPLLTSASERAGLRTRPTLLEAGSGDADLPRRRPAELGLVQFTSGSSGSPRGVQLRPDHIEANVAMIRGWLGMTADHGTASWLPLYHDMGLIGCLITPVLNQSDLYLMQPTQFVQHPLRWLECFGRGRAHVTAAPNFCMEYLLRIGRRPRYQEQVAAMDFAGWQALILGAERIDPSAMRRFAEWLAPQGFRATTFRPAYGLAEATLCVTGVREDERSRAVLPAWETLELGQPVEILEAADAISERIGKGAGWLAGCGHPMAGVEVAVVDQHGATVRDGVVGEIGVISPAVCTGYRGAGEDRTTIRDGRLRTGDAGFVHAGELYVVGRMGDSLKIRGRSVFVEDLEAKLAELPGVEQGQFVVVPGRTGGEDSVLVLAERSKEGWPEAAVGRLRQELGSGVEVDFVAVPRGFILRTSSGKPRRRVIWKRLASGDIGAAGMAVEDRSVVEGT
jgi:acyl-CoA synthetase (AMP-forming)/AMP-acid ligase II